MTRILTAGRGVCRGLGSSASFPTSGARNRVISFPAHHLTASAPPSSRNSEYRRSIATPGNNRASHPDDRATVIIGLAGR